MSGESEHDVARAFDAEMFRGYETLKQEAAYDATRFKQMLDQHGGAETARRLVRGPTHTSGLDRLWEKGRLGTSVEATVLKPAYESLFDDDLKEAARQRLAAYAFDVDRWPRTLG